ncbi:MAG: ATP-binding protein [Christensenellales bacterium]|jgi:signal transduction histidine kinase
MKGSFLRKMLFLVMLTVLLCGVFTASLYMAFTTRAFADIKSQELAPRARAISDIFVMYSQGQISTPLFRQILASDGMMWDAGFLLINSRGDIIASVRHSEAAFEIEEAMAAISLRAEEVMAGDDISFVGNPPGRDMPLLIVGAPAMVNGETIAAVFLIKPLHEINTALSSLNYSLIYALLITTAAMALLAYIGSRNIARPVRLMSRVAMGMASGNFSMRANEDTQDELGQLGAALNYLSKELSNTIAELQLEKNRLVKIIDSMNEGLVAVDAAGGITLSNPAMQQFIRARASKEDYLRVIKSGRFESEIIDTGDKSIRRSITPIVEDDGRVSGALALYLDVTEQEKLERLRRDYVANVSHELRTPLTSMRALIEPLKDNLVKNEEKKAKYYDIIYRETIRLTQLINEVLDLSRLQSGKAEIACVRLNIKDIIDDVKARHDAVAARKNITISADAQPELYAFGDGARVEQVLVILVDNAIKYTGEGGHISIVTREEAGSVVISVKDNGPGISPEDIDHVFDRFYKADRSRSEKSMGLGLAIAKEALRLMGEKIGVISREGEGAEFWFTLRKREKCSKSSESK